MSIYDCTLLYGTVVATCYESVDQLPPYNEDEKDFKFEDGGCCEDKYGSPLCCIIRLNRANAFK